MTLLAVVNTVAWLLMGAAAIRVLVRRRVLTEEGRALAVLVLATFALSSSGMIRRVAPDYADPAALAVYTVLAAVAVWFLTFRPDAPYTDDQPLEGDTP